MFQLSIFLNHFNKFRFLYIKVNIFKKKKFSIMIYYIKKKFKLLNKSLVFILMKSILFLSKLLMLTEIKY